MVVYEGIVVIEEDIHTLARVTMILEDYVFDRGRRFADIHGIQQGMTKHREFCLDALQQCKNRLGGERHKQLMRLMGSSFEFDQHEQTGETKACTESVLNGYWLTITIQCTNVNQAEQSGGKVLYFVAN
jgi:hypothetical protein